ncbi:MAG: lysophospholipid acyltransferase family protein [Thermoleophilaceae bacterium]
MDIPRALRALPTLPARARDRFRDLWEEDVAEDGERSFRSGYEDDRPAEELERFHTLARERTPSHIYEGTRLLFFPFVGVLWRPRPVDSHHVPAAGPVILAPNHFSFLDHFFAGIFLRRKVVYVAKSQLFRLPLELWLAQMRAFPIRRGRGDTETFTTANAVLGRGGVVLMYAEGGRARGEALGSPRSGVGRLALESGVPVVPVAIVGTQGVRDWRSGRFPKVTIRYGDAIRFEHVAEPDRDQARAAADEIFTRVRRLHQEVSSAA